VTRFAGLRNFIRSPAGRQTGVFLRRIPALVLAAAAAVAVAAPLAGCASSSDPNAIDSMGAMGDSITRGFDACTFLQDCPAKSWATGTDTGVDSHFRRLLVKNSAIAGHVYNVAKTGATSADLPAQATALAARKPDYVTVLMGSNDACADSEAAMTSVTDFRSRVDTALATVYRARPDTQVLVASVPDLYRLWQVGHGDARARLVWSAGFCHTMLDAPTSTAPADEARRQRVRSRVIAYNAALAASCRAHAGCRYDNGAVFGNQFTLGDLSPFDYFHPNTAGQHKLAAVTWAKTGF
jgi:lysophospholipase L1-like esterase